MTILAVHRKQPNWPVDEKRPIFQQGPYWVETDGPEPTAEEVAAVVSPPLPTRAQKLERFLQAHGLTTQDLVDAVANRRA